MTSQWDQWDHGLIYNIMTVVLLVKEKYSVTSRFNDVEMLETVLSANYTSEKKPLLEWCKLHDHFKINDAFMCKHHLCVAAGKDRANLNYSRHLCGNQKVWS